MKEAGWLPEGIRRHVGAAYLAEESLGRSGARVFDAGGCFLKIAPRGELERAAAMQDYFARKGLGAPLIAFDQDGARDYLLVQTLPGQNACRWPGEPARLAAALGEAIRALHETDARDCPLADVNERWIDAYGKEHGAPFAGDVSILQKDALTHGECCLPNIFFDGGCFAGFIDMGDAGLGDRHVDLSSAVWSLGYNLRTTRWNERLLDAYGRDAIDAARLALCDQLR